MKILIVDDVPELGEWIKLLILKKQPSSKIRVSSSAIEATRFVERERPDVVLLDEVLGTGDDFLHLLSYLQQEKIKTVLISGIYSEKPLPQGITHRLLKPDWETGKREAEFLESLARALS